jgi:beta-glucosidase
VAVTLRPSDLAFYDQQMRQVVEPGTFTVWVGTSSADERQSAHFEVIGDLHQLGN